MSEMTPLSEDALVAQGVLQEILRTMHFPADVAVSETPEQIVLTMSSSEPLGVLIGRNGQTLNAIELLVKTITQHKLHHFYRHLLVDAEGYRQRQTARLEEIAREAATRVMESGEAVCAGTDERARSPHGAYGHRGNRRRRQLQRRRRTLPPSGDLPARRGGSEQ